MLGFDESYMSTGAELKGSGIVGFGASNRTPATSRVERKAASSPRLTKSTRKGMARSCVLVARKDNDPRTYEVFVKGSGVLLGTVRTAKGARGRNYSYKLVSEARSHAGFTSQKAAVLRMLEKV